MENPNPNWVGLAVLLLAATLWLGSPVEARCRRSQVCDDFGQNCQVEDLCDSRMGLPSTNLPPLPPLPSTKLKPLPPTGLPPLG